MYHHFFWLMQANCVQACVVCDQEAAIYLIVPGVIINLWSEVIKTSFNMEFIRD